MVGKLVVDEAHLQACLVIEVSTQYLGELKLIAAPAGVLRGYDALPRGRDERAPRRRPAARRSLRPVTFVAMSGATLMKT